jgi:hypothetical protein
MRAAGVEEIDSGRDFASLRPPGWQERLPVRHGMYLMTRDRTDAIVRGLLRETPVRIEQRIEVTGLLSSPRRGRRVVGVSARARDGGATSEIEGDLVVDASGRASKAPRGWARWAWRARETVVDSFAQLHSRWYLRGASSRWWWKGAWIDPTPPERLMGSVLFPVEATLDRHADRLLPLLSPTDEQGFARDPRLRSPIIAEALALASRSRPCTRRDRCRTASGTTSMKERVESSPGSATACASGRSTGRA